MPQGLTIFDSPTDVPSSKKGGGIGPSQPPSGLHIFSSQYDEPEEPEQSWWDWGVGMGIRTVPALAGGALGAASGLLTAGTTSYPGMMLGAGAGGALGEALAEWYEGKNLNPWQIGTQGVLGGLTAPIGGKLAGTGLGQIAKYAAKEAAAGGVLGGLSAVPTELAETGKLPTWGQIGANTAAGAGFGLATGAGIGAGARKFGWGAAPDLPREATPPPPPGQLNLDFGPAPPPYRPPPTGGQLELPMTPGGSSIFNVAPTVENMAPPAPPPGGGGDGSMPFVVSPEVVNSLRSLGVDDTTINNMSGVDIWEYLKRGGPDPATIPAPRPDVPPAGVATAGMGQVPPQEGAARPRFIVRNWDAQSLQEAEQAGYTGGGTTPDRQVFRVIPNPAIDVTLPATNTNAINDLLSRGYWRGGDQPDGKVTMYAQTGESAAPAAPRSALRGEIQRFANGNEIESFDPDLPFAVPTKSLTREFIKSMDDQGIEQISSDPNGDTVFQKILDDVDDEPAFDRAFPADQNLMKGSAGQGLDRYGLPFDLQWREAVQEANKLGIDWKSYNNLDELQWDITRKVAQETVRTGRNPLAEIDEARGYQVKLRTLRDEIAKAHQTGDTARMAELAAQVEEVINAKLAGPQQQSFDDPSFARIPGKGLTASMNTTRGIENITRDYTSPLPGIMAREGLQNALDAADKLGMDGEVKIRMSRRGKTIEIYDNGSGLDEDQLAYKLIEVFSSGKEGDEGATGGKGIGSASYIYGGDHFEIETVAVDSADGLKYRIKAGGTPKQFFDKVQGSDWDKQVVDDYTPTGTTMKVKLKDSQDMAFAADMVERVVAHTRNRTSRILVDKGGYSSGPVSEMIPGTDVTEHRFAPSSGDKLIGDFTTVNRNSEIKVLVPAYDATVSRDVVNVHYLNNGMYQFSKKKGLPAKGEGIPENIIVDIHPLVDDIDDLYPFINTREDIKDDIRTEVNDFIDTNIANPGISKRKYRTQELYDSMTTKAPITGVHRTPIIFDPGNRLTPQELESVTKSSAAQQMIRHWDGVINEILVAVDRKNWTDRLEGVGMVMDPGLNGVHIPNPTTKKSSILLNPFAGIEAGNTPKQQGWDNTITNMHEVAHIGTESQTPVRFSDADKKDPRMGEFFSAYMNEIVRHGDISFFSGTGHGMDFSHRLGEVYAKYGIQRTFAAADRMERVLTGGNNKSGSYSPEVQRLLQLYKESRGRPATTEDLLSPTGVKSANTGAGQGGIPGTNQANGAGVPPQRPVINPVPTGSGKPPVVKKKKEKPSFLQELWNLPRAATTTMDLSAPLRQGLPLMFTKEWAKSWKQMLQAAGSEKAYEASLQAIKNRKLFKGEINLVTGKIDKSFAERVGMTLSDLKSLSTREESLASTWIETGGKYGGKVGYKQTLGRGARSSNRAYTAYLNQLRADTFERLINSAKKNFDAGIVGAKNPMEDLTFAREIADFVNTATGRAPLKVARPTIKDGKVILKESNFERSAKILSNTLFSPRLMASRVRMLNPMTYAMASPFVRKQYLHAFINTGIAWGSVAMLGKMAGAEVSGDPNSADFGKLRIGNTRLDPAGGFQQYWVALSRLLSGHTTSSATQSDFELGEGYRAETRKDVGERFGANKLHPMAKFAYDLLNAAEYTPFHVKDRTAQLFVPLVIQDLMELAEQDPDLLPLMVPVAAGMGTQTYGKGESRGKIVSPQNDILFRGGSLY